MVDRMIKLKTLAPLIYTAALSCCALAGANAADEKEASAEDSPLKAEFLQQARTYEQLFKERNASALADLWTKDGALETSNGLWRGRRELIKYFEEVFDKYGAQSLCVKIVSVEEKAPGIAIEEGTTATGGGPPDGKYTAVHIKCDEGWKMVWVSETAIRPSSMHLKDLVWLRGKWKAATKDGGDLSIQIKLIENNSFLECTTYDASLKSEMRQIIGYNPIIGTLVSWHFTPNGGFGKGHWSKLSHGWRQETSGVMPNGAVTAATYTLKQRSKDCITWQSTERSVQGVSIPDSAILVLNRVAE